MNIEVCPVIMPVKFIFKIPVDLIIPERPLNIFKFPVTRPVRGVD